MALLADPLFKFKSFIDNDDNNCYRSINKITPSEAGLSDADLEKFLNRLNKNTSKLDNKKINLTKSTKSEELSDKPIQSSKVFQEVNRENNYGKILSHSETRELFKNINKIRREHYLQDRHNKIMDWYYDNRYSVNLLFKESIFFLMDEDVEFTVSNKELYNNFVEYCYDNYMKFHI